MRRARRRQIPALFSGGVRQPYFEAQWDFASTVPGSQQVGLSVVASPDRGDTARMSWVQMQDTPTGLQVNFEDYDHSILNFTTTPIATSLDRTITHTIKITMQFVDGPSNDIVKVYVDGALAHTGTSWEDYFRDFEVGVPHAVDSIMFRTAGTAAPANLGNGFLIDNFSEFSGPVPVVTATLHVIKHVVNDNGGVAAASDFNVHVQQSGSDVAGSPAVGQESPGNTYILAPNTYVISEDNNTSYTKSFSGDCDASGNIILAPGDNKMCTITNDDIAPQLTVNKIVVNNNGRTKAVSDFPLFIDGSSVTSGAVNAISAGPHTVSETSDSNYTSAISGDCAADGTITLALGDNKTCTITNDDIPPVQSGGSGGNNYSLIAPMVPPTPTPNPTPTQTTQTTPTTTSENVAAIQAQLNELLATLSSLQAQTQNQASNAFTQPLAYGLNNKQVVLLQDTLKNFGFFPKSVGSNGNFGPTTLKAVQDFQVYYNIAKPGGFGYGNVGPSTRKELSELLNGNQ